MSHCLQQGICKRDGTQDCAPGMRFVPLRYVNSPPISHQFEAPGVGGRAYH